VATSLSKREHPALGIYQLLLNISPHGLDLLQLCESLDYRLPENSECGTLRVVKFARPNVEWEEPAKSNAFVDG
jgi:hypothetical protein